MTQNVIDETSGLIYCQQEKGLWERVLRSFHLQHRSYLACQTLSPEEARQLAHDLKSTAPPCGALQLADLAQKIAPPAALPDACSCAQLLHQLQLVLAEIESRYLIASGTNALYSQLIGELEQHNLNALATFRQWVTDDVSGWPQSSINATEQALQAFDFERAKACIQDCKIRYGLGKR